MPSNIYGYDDVNKLLGCICNDTSLILNDKYPLKRGEKGDFSECLFHRIIFGACYAMTKQGAKEILPIDIDMFIQNNFGKENYVVFEDNNGIDYITTIKQLSDVKNYDMYYNVVRKYSLLRRYEEKHNISEIWDRDKSDEKNIENLNKWEIEDIINYFEAEQNSIKRDFTSNGVKEEYVAGTDFMETKEKFKQTALVGASFQSELLNGVFRGMFGFILRVAKSGGGKSTMSLGDLCKTTCTEYWDEQQNKFVKNKSREGASLFINTEMEIRSQLDVMIISWIANVDRSHIIDGNYEESEEDRVNYACKVLLESELYIVDDPEFTANSLVYTIKDYCFRKNIKTVCFDYIQDNTFMSKFFSNESKIPMRQDMALLALTDRLKQVQRDCNINLISSVQTNSQEDTMEYPTEVVLAGGKSQVRKTDGTMCMLPPTKKELEQTALLLKKRGFDVSSNYVNNVVHIIKGRNSKYPKNIKIFQHISLGTGRSVDLYCTDCRNNPIQVDKLVIEHE